jgi:hypothetical protein
MRLSLDYYLDEVQVFNSVYNSVCSALSSVLWMKFML